LPGGSLYALLWRVRNAGPLQRRTGYGIRRIAVNLRRAQPLVREFCGRYGLPLLPDQRARLAREAPWV